jgi:hypothetical protein
MAKEKALFGEWATLKPADVNRILKPHGVRLVVKGSKAWGAKVNVTAQRIPQPDDVIVARPAGDGRGAEPGGNDG